MAQDLIAGKHFPIYFYGQKYGLSTFEVFSVAFWIKLIGTGVWALRLGGLTLFALGTTFLFKGLLNRGQPLKLSFLIVVAVLCFPSWTLWAGMVRGGYVTAFCAISILFYLSSRFKFSILNYLIIGFLLAVAFESHVFLLIPILPLLLFNWRSQGGSILNLLIIGIISVLFIFGIKSLDFQDVLVWNSPSLDVDFSAFYDRGLIYGKGILHSFGNFTYFTADMEIPLWWKIGLSICLLLIGFLAVRLFLKISNEKKIYYLLSVFGLLLIFFVALSMRIYIPRYLISIYTGVLFLLLFMSKDLLADQLNRSLSVVMLVLFMIGIGAGPRQKRDFFPSDVNKLEAFNALHEEVKKGDFKAVFVCDHFIQWQWNYLYGAEIPANAFNLVERTQQFNLKVDSIYLANPKETAIISYWGIFYNLEKVEGFDKTRRQVGNDYCIQPIVTKAFHDKGYETMGAEYVYPERN